MAGAVFGDVGCMVTSVAPRIGNDVSYVTGFNKRFFAWQAQ